MRVLVVQEDDGAVETLAQGLRRNGYSVDHVDTARQALKTYHHADLVLLDLELPDLDGLRVCRDVRAVSDTPIIALTARSTELDRILGLQAGLDDYVTKPYVFHELVARMEAVMRRSRRQSHAGRDVLCGRLRIDSARREVHMGDQLVSLTAKEFDLLSLLACQPDTVISRKEIMSRVWHADLTHYSRTIDTHVSNLRRKLNGNGWIVTVRGVGFRLGSG